MEGITKKLLLLYTGTYVITKDNNNNTYELKNVNSHKIKGSYNQLSIKKYFDENIPQNSKISVRSTYTKIKKNV